MKRLLICLAFVRLKPLVAQNCPPGSDLAPLETSQLFGRVGLAAARNGKRRGCTACGVEKTVGVAVVESGDGQTTALSYL